MLTVVRLARDHPTAADVYDRVRGMHPGIAYATVYNALSYLVRNGLIRELKFGGGGACRYDGRLDPHLHVICTTCGALAETEMDLPRQYLVTVQKATGFALDGQPLQLFGICPSCVRQQSTGSN